MVQQHHGGEVHQGRVGGRRPGGSDEPAWAVSFRLCCPALLGQGCRSPNRASTSRQVGTGNTRDENRPGDRARSVSWFQSRIQPGGPGPLAPPVGRV